MGQRPIATEAKASHCSVDPLQLELKIGSAASNQKRAAAARPKPSANDTWPVKLILRMRIEASFNRSDTMISCARKFPGGRRAELAGTDGEGEMTMRVLLVLAAIGFSATAFGLEGHPGRRRRFRTRSRRIAPATHPASRYGRRTPPNNQRRPIDRT